jgi:hypothetical protein
MAITDWKVDDIVKQNPNKKDGLLPFQAELRYKITKIDTKKKEITFIVVEPQRPENQYVDPRYIFPVSKFEKYLVKA